MTERTALLLELADRRDAIDRTQRRIARWREIMAEEHALIDAAVARIVEIERQLRHPQPHPEGDQENGPPVC